MNPQGPVVRRPQAPQTAQQAIAQARLNPQVDMPEPPAQASAPEFKEPVPGQSATDKLPTAAEYMEAKRAIDVPKYTYTVPESCRTRQSDPKEFTVIELDGYKVALAHQVGDGNASKVVEELCKLCLYAVDGKKISVSDAEADVYWARWSPKCRDLLRGAYSIHHSTTDAEKQAFFASRKVVLSGS